jgi:hypothetical protein
MTLHSAKQKQDNLYNLLPDQIKDENTDSWRPADNGPLSFGDSPSLDTVLLGYLGRSGELPDLNVLLLVFFTTLLLRVLRDSWADFPFSTSESKM